jgi:serine/threonine-protein kinase SRPK3
VLICIENVESIIQNELASASANGTPPTRLVGVPPSRGRGGNQTPRPDSVFITGSQPLPSPSSSHGASPMLDRWAFGMSKIDGVASTAPSGPGSFTSPPGGSARDSSVDAKQVHAVEMDQASERIAQLLREPGFDESNSRQTANVPSGPSLLSQQAPPHGRPIGTQRRPADGSDDGFSPSSSGAGSSMALDPQSAGLEAMDRITVKIADLGNGERPSPHPPFIVFSVSVLTISVVDASSDLGEPPFYG